MVESAIILGIALFIVFGILDLGLAVLHYNTISEGARRVARAGIVHGREAEPEGSVWGPATYSGTAADQSEIAASILPAITVLDPAQVSVQVEWPDGQNEPDDLLRVTVRTTYRPILPKLVGRDAIELSAVSLMRIQH
jgi:hypothetical protein